MLQLLLSCVLLAIAYVGARAMMLAQEEIPGVNEPGLYRKLNDQQKGKR